MKIAPFLLSPGFGKTGELRAKFWRTSSELTRIEK
jgi:hypothetical protein